MRRSRTRCASPVGRHVTGNRPADGRDLCALPVRWRVNRVLAVTANRYCHSERDRRAIRSSSGCPSTVHTGRFSVVKDSTWTTRSCYPIPMHRNTSLRTKPPETRSNTRSSRTGPTPRLPFWRRDDRERFYGCATVHPSCAYHAGPLSGRRHRRRMVAAFGLSSSNGDSPPVQPTYAMVAARAASVPVRNVGWIAGANSGL